MTRGKVLRLFLSVAVVIGFVVWSVGPAMPSDSDRDDYQHAWDRDKDKDKDRDWGKTPSLPPDPPSALNLHVIGALDFATCDPSQPVGGNNCTGAQQRQYSKNGDWPTTRVIDGKDIFNTGCYEGNIDPAMPGCFRVVDVSDPRHPKRIAEVPVYDPVNSPLPPPPTDNSFWGPAPGYSTLHWDINVWKNPKFNGQNCVIYDGNVLGSCTKPLQLTISTACGDWKVESNGKYHAENVGQATCWDKGWVTRTHYTAGADGEYQLPGYDKGSRKNEYVYWVNNMLQGGAPNNRPCYTGISFWDLRDPHHPEYLSRIEATVGIDSNGNYSNAMDIGSDGKGVHHGMFDGRYAFTGWTEYGYLAQILVIVDAKDPRHPKLASKWWVPGQKTPAEDGIRNSLGKYPGTDIEIGWKQVTRAQPVTRDAATGLLQMDVFMHYVSVTTIKGRDIAFLSYGGAGLIILDVTDRTSPKFISQVSYNTPDFQANDMSGPIEPTTGLPWVQLDHKYCQETWKDTTTWTNANVNKVEAAAGRIACGNSHSGKIVPGTNNTLYWHTDESSNPHGHLRLFDVSDLTHPKILSNFFLPPRPSPTSTDSRTFKRGGLYIYSQNWAALSENFALAQDYPESTPGTHIGNAYDSNLLFLAWYGAGVVVVDISHPKHPKLAGYYQYIIQDGKGGTGTYDVIFDQRGHVVVTDRNDGVRILKYTGPGAPLYTGPGTTALDFKSNGKDKDKDWWDDPWDRR